MRSYKERWVGDDSDVLLPDRVHAFVDIDMTAWAASCLTATDALFSPHMAGAIAALDPDCAAALAGLREQFATLIAGTLTAVLLAPGEAPAVESARALFRRSLLERLGAAYASRAGDAGPVLVCPPSPVVRDGRAVTASAPGSVAEALLWDCVVTVATSQAAQDELLLSVIAKDLPAAPADLATATCVVAPPPSATLLDALARMAFEHPQVWPHLAKILKGGDPIVARAALQRLTALIGEVARTWPEWFEGAPPAAEGAGPAPAVEQAGWSYLVDFSQLPVLRLTRLPVAGGALPPWPAIAGFVTPSEKGQATDRYQAEASAPFAAEAPLTFIWAGLPLLWAPAVQVAASARRNANLVPPGAPDGTLVDPAFVYRTPPVLGAAIRPFADLPSSLFKVGAGAATLSEAMDDLLASLLAGPTLAGLALRDVRIDLDISYNVALGAEETPLDSGVPIFRTRETLASSPAGSDGTVAVAAFRRDMVEALVAWRAAARPEDSRAALCFAIGLSTAGPESPFPLVRLGRVEIKVPMAQGDWWQ
ncbi:hypothetical protein GCM10009087_14980 [Sphingomonas oligophenolica]